MNATMISAPCFIILVCLVALACGELTIGSTALAQERHYYASTVDHAAHAVLQKLSNEKEVNKGARISKVGFEDTKVAESILYSINLQMDIDPAHRGTNYELQFVHPVSEWRSVRTSNALPYSHRARHSPSTSLTLPGTTNYYLTPEISITLNGPMELYFPHSTTELIVKTPRVMDVGFVERIVVKEGANITLTGSAELRLRDSLSVYPTISMDEGLLVVNTKDTPKINVYGHRIEIKNNEGEQLKVQKKFSSVLEIAPSRDTPVSSVRLPFQIPLNDSRIQTLNYAMQQWGTENNFPGFTPSIRKLSSGSSMEAVVSFLIPLEVEDSVAGTSTQYEVVVVQGSNHREAKVISIAQAPVHTQVTFDSALAVNGSLPDALDRLQTYLQANGRMTI